MAKDSLLVELLISIVQDGVGMCYMGMGISIRSA